MKKTNLFLVSIALTTTLASESFAYFHLCAQRSVIQNVKTPEDAARFLAQKTYFDSTVNIDLIKYRAEQIAIVQSGKKRPGPQYLVSNAAIDALNARFPDGTWTRNKQVIVETLNKIELSNLNPYTPVDPQDRRHDFLPDAGDIPAAEFGRIIMETIDRNDVVGYMASGKYQQRGTNIGYCFGRGCYIDVLLMTLGVDRDAIKKIWAVGPMSAGGITWQFHIGHMVRLPDNRWIVLDNVPGRVLTAEQWAAHFQKQSQDGLLRIFITDSEKFTPSLGAYDPVQLGTNGIPRSKDWYKGYFVDLFAWAAKFRSLSPEEQAEYFGIRVDQLPKRPTPLSPTPEQIAASNREEQLFMSFPPKDVPLQPGGRILSAEPYMNKDGNDFMDAIKGRIDRLKNRLGIDD